MNLRQRAALITLAILVGILAVPVVLTWRQVRQERLNQDLIAAVDRNDPAGVRSLLHAGANPNAPVLPDDKQPVWKRMWDLLRHRPDPQAPTQDTVLLKATYWIPDYDPGKYGALEFPIVDNYEVVKALVDAGANVNVMNDQGETPLTRAVGHSKHEAAKILLAHHAEVNVADTDGTTPLMMAAWDEDADLVEALIAHGANIYARDRNRETVLLSAVGQHTRRPSVAKERQTIACLLRHGVPLGGTDLQGFSPLFLVHDLHYDSELTQMLYKAGARYNDHDKQVLRMFKQAGAKQGKQR